MARQRTTKSLASRIELDYYQRRHPLRVWRARIAFAAFVLPLLLLVGLAVRRDDRAWSPGPLSAAHAAFAARCEACHTPWGGVEDARCSHCHAAASHHESPEQRPRCASCHREHGGRQTLAHAAAVADAHCTQCHADLSALGDRQSLRSARHVESFATHVEFAVLRDRKPDPGTVKLDHAKHLSLEMPELGRKLDCGDCHRPDATGRRMQPITYARDCASCHALGLEGRLAGASVTHGRSIARLEEELRALAMARALDAESDPAKLRAWVDGAVREAREYLETTRCAECHAIAVPPNSAPIAAPDVLSPAIPARWFASAEFDHARHAGSSSPDPGQAPDRGCADCHSKVSTSSKTADVNLPDIARCQTCHETGGAARADCSLCHQYHPKSQLLAGPVGRVGSR